MLSFVATAALVGAVSATSLVRVVSNGALGPAYISDDFPADVDPEVLRPFAHGLDNSHQNEPRQLRDPDADLNVTQIIQRWNYPVENHIITTKDGYILQIQRIPRGRNNEKSVGPPRVAYLQHGLLSSSFDFVCNPPEQSLGFIMADRGYDVWLGNVRGNTYGRQHVNMSADDNAFWEFTFDEFIAIDVPTIIDYILEKTGQESLYYVGHSQGTVVMFGLLSTRMEYQKKIRAYAALAPVANVTKVTSPIRWLAPISSDIAWIIEWLGTGEFLSNSRIIKFLAKTMCGLEVTREICEDAIFVICGIDSKQLNATRMSVYMSHTPAGTSVRNVVHFAQEIEAKRFQMYDFGVKENKKRYGQPTPPEYDTRNIHEVPIALYWSQNDWLGDPSDVKVLQGRLPSVKRVYEVPESKFTHLDFLIGVRAAELVYADMLNFLDKY